MQYSLARARKRTPDPTEPRSGGLLFLSLLAATGFAWGWLAQAGHFF